MSDSSELHEERRRHIEKRVAHEEKLRRRFALLRGSTLHCLVLLATVVAWWPFRFAPPWPVVHDARFTSESLRIGGAGMVMPEVPTNPTTRHEEVDVAHFELACASDHDADDNACLLSAGPVDAPSDRGLVLAAGNTVPRHRFFSGSWQEDDPQSGEPRQFDLWLHPSNGPGTLRITLGNDLGGRHPCSGLVSKAAVTIGDRRFDLLDPKQAVRPSWY